MAVRNQMPSKYRVHHCPYCGAYPGQRCVSVPGGTPQGGEHTHRKGLVDPSYLMDSKGRTKKGVQQLESALPLRKLKLAEWHALYKATMAGLDELPREQQIAACRVLDNELLPLLLAAGML